MAPRASGWLRDRGLSPVTRLLLALPELDLEWEHHPSHFWLFLTAAAVNAGLAYLTNVVGGRYRDARLVLISLAFLSRRRYPTTPMVLPAAARRPGWSLGLAVDRG